MMLTPSVSADPVSIGETIRTISSALTMLASLWVARMVFLLRDDVRDLMRDIGKDGSDGIKAIVALHGRRLDTIEGRFIAIDAVEEAERNLHEGPDKRQTSRRLMDELRQLHERSDRPTHRQGDVTE
jgi:hypothetical protein